MFIRASILMLGVVCTCAATATAQPGYLQVVGPSALRFRAPDIAPGKSGLPPLPADLPAPAVATPPSAINPDSANVTTKAGGEPSTTTALTAADGAPLTADMLVEIFRSRFGDGHGRGEKTIVPFGFVPPSAGAGGSSSATYETK